MSRGASTRVASLAAALCLALLATRAEAAAEHRFALVIGNSQGGPGTRPLRFAERDAQRIHSILVRLGGVDAADARLLTGSDADAVRAALRDLGLQARTAHARGEPTLLFVFYSGHARDGDLRLGDTRLPLDELRAALRDAPADVRIGLLDSCQSGLITRGKGIRAAPAFDVSGARATSLRGLVLIASSSADEESQESDEIGGSFFTHYLASGLLGDADTSGDGRVTLAEAYTYAYARTVGGTVETRAGTQHPVYLYDLGGAGDVVLTELSPARGSLVFAEAAEGSYVVLDGTRRAVAEVAKVAGSRRQLALQAGKYLVKKRLADGLLVGEVRIADEPVALDESHWQRRSLEDDPQKGASGPRFGLLASGGGQFFFDAAARNGLFPPAALGGVQLTARDDLGHALSWGLDLAVGAGASDVRLTGLDPIPVRFTELTGGASLRREFALTDALAFSLGVRLAALAIFRTFPGHRELSSQNFFTVTPGLEAGLAWQLSDRFSAVLRGRLNYLFYNVDQNRSLGFGELAVGVEYALGR